MAEIENLKIDGGATYTVGNEDIIANEWEASKTYVKGKSYVIYEHGLYVCNTTHTSVSPIDLTKWTAITIGEAIAANTTDIGNLTTLTTTDKSSIVGAVNEVNKVTTGTFTADSNITLLRSTLIKANAIKFLSIIFAVTGSGTAIGTMSSGFGASYNYDFTIANDNGTTTRARINQNNTLSFSTTPVQNIYYALTIVYV